MFVILEINYTLNLDFCFQITIYFLMCNIQHYTYKNLYNQYYLTTLYLTSNVTQLLYCIYTYLFMLKDYLH